MFTSPRRRSSSPSGFGLSTGLCIIVVLIGMLALLNRDVPSTATADTRQSSTAIKSAVSPSADWAVTWNPTNGELKAYKLYVNTPNLGGTLIFTNADPISSISVSDNSRVRVIFESRHYQEWDIYTGQLLVAAYLTP